MSPSTCRVEFNEAAAAERARLWPCCRTPLGAAAHWPHISPSAVINPHVAAPGMEESLWTAEDTKICEEGIASGLAVHRATGRPVTFEDLQKLHTEYGGIRGTVDGEAFYRERVRSVPFGSAGP